MVGAHLDWFEECSELPIVLWNRCFWQIPPLLKIWLATFVPPQPTRSHSSVACSAAASRLHKKLFFVFLVA